MFKTKILTASVIFLLSFAFFSAARAETLKIGFVTDWEYGKQKEYDRKLPNKADNYLKKAVKHYNDVFRPDLAVGGGDYILSRNISGKKAKKQLKEINKIFKRVSAPRLYCIGNHDLADFSKQEVGENLGIDYNHSVTDMNGMRIITVDTNDIVPGRDGYGVIGRMPDGELAWLDEKLNTSLPVIVFSHHSPIQTPQGGDWRTNIIAADEVRAVLEKYGNVIAVFSGHHAINYKTGVNGINYVIINNLTDEKAKGSYADITVEMNEAGDEIGVSVSQYGKKPTSYYFTKTLSSD